MRQQFYVFLLRWALNTVGLWASVGLFGTNIEAETLIGFLGMFLLAGLIFSIINSVIRPIVIILSLPVMLITLGLFTLVVNGLMVYVSLKLSPGIDMAFGGSILAGIVMSLVNYIISGALDYKKVVRK